MRVRQRNGECESTKTKKQKAKARPKVYVETRAGHNNEDPKIKDKTRDTQEKYSCVFTRQEKGKSALQSKEKG